jgi:hypothetical protein
MFFCWIFLFRSYVTQICSVCLFTGLQLTSWANLSKFLSLFSHNPLCLFTPDILRLIIVHFFLLPNIKDSCAYLQLISWATLSQIFLACLPTTSWASFHPRLLYPGLLSLPRLLRLYLTFWATLSQIIFACLPMTSWTAFYPRHLENNHRTSFF